MGYIAGLIDGTVRVRFPRYVQGVLEASREREYLRLIERLQTAENEDRKGLLTKLMAIESATTTAKIRRLQDIPNIQTLEIRPADFLVPGLIARETIMIWTGPCGDMKSLLIQNMAVAVASGGEFLGRRCKRAPVLYLDYENPAFAVKDRLELFCDGVLEELHIWGNWNEQPPPMVGSDILMNIAKESRPLLIIDPLRYAHTADENDSTEMSSVMKSLKGYAAAGCSVVVLHHPGKAEGSQSRGSSVIRDHADVSLLHELNADTGLISLSFNKNRLGLELTALTIRPDLELGTFEITDSPAFTKHTEECQRLQDLIVSNPGVTQNRIIEMFGGMKSRVAKLLKEGDGSLWETSKGPNRATLYHPIRWFAESRTTSRTTEPPMAGLSGSVVLSPLGENHQNHQARLEVTL